MLTFLRLDFAQVYFNYQAISLWPHDEVVIVLGAFGDPSESIIAEKLAFWLMFSGELIDIDVVRFELDSININTVIRLSVDIIIDTQ